ncbi:beta-ketoacyl-[acyl-carrier-protein] synthase family protein [Burkholderia sp. MS455]|uniref:beta-ketoacyl-[acyl-carrier-protein] synthase family protein n=1 Tax=Burkholderia sp. MS455 TaxID=2811788 RepID=UPI001EF55815|nr:beta-ketoacyl-[acyl-carrier-protein] synthase family protein [Burkholderia sp. MS455]
MASTWQAMVEGRDGIQRLHLDADSGIVLRSTIAAVVNDFDPAQQFDRKMLRVLDRVAQFAIVAADEAIESAQLDFTKNSQLASRTALIIGTANGGEIARDLGFRDIYRNNKHQLDPSTILRIMPSAPGSHISIRHGITGPSFVVSSACASSNHAFAQAVHLLRAGIIDVALVGGAEASLSPGFIKAWEAMRVLSDDTCRPFSANRSGLVLGEGAAMFVLETDEHACRRDAPILCEVSGVGMSSDARDMLLPSESGMSAAIELALRDAGWRPEDVDYVNAHGTGTRANDEMEMRAIGRVFGTHGKQVSVSSTKSMHGHLIGAAGALELVATLGAIMHDVVPPTIHLDTLDPQCALNVTPNYANHRPIRSAISNSFAFGGTNAVIAIEKWHA